MSDGVDNQVCEGLAKVFLPPSVFYNPVQEFNRDLTIAVITEHARSLIGSTASGKDAPAAAVKPAETGRDTAALGTAVVVPVKVFTAPTAGTSTDKKDGIRILEGLAASGLRSVRFALEIPGVREVIANDYDSTAVEYIRRNAEHNGVSNVVTPSCADAAMVMYKSRSKSRRFDVVDLDPYGSPSPFLDAAVQSVADGGLLCVTCTDMAVLCGNAAESCHSKYGAVSFRAPFCHEMALRILLQSIAAHAARHGRYIEPLLSLSVDFYVRVFVRLRSSQILVKDVPTKISHVFHCRSCGAFSLQPVMTKSKNVYVASSGPTVDRACVHCRGRHIMAGPIWSAPIHDMEFVNRVGAAVDGDSKLFPSTRQRIIGTLSVVREELLDQPLYYVGDSVSGTLHCTPPGFLPMRSALLHAGYQVSLSHAHKNSIKTNAPADVIWDIMRCWVRDHPVTEKRLQEDSTVRNILSKPPALEANFSTHPLANPESRSKGLVRWQMNPERNWGPKPRAARSGRTDTVEERCERGLQRAEAERSKRKADVDLKKYPCKKHREGSCDLGDGCRYSHDENTEEAELLSDTEITEDQEEEEGGGEESSDLPPEQYL